MADETQTPEDETPETDAPAAPEPEAPAAEEPVAEEAPAEEAAAPVADEAEEAAAPAAAAAEPEAPVAPKERRRRSRAAKAAQIPVRPPRTPEERHAERLTERKRKAQVRSTRRKQEREKARAQRTATPEPLAPRREPHPGQQKTRQGIVVSDRASKTIVVRIDVTRRHPFYEKIVRTSRTLHAHDEREDAHIGDTVVVRESRPLSRTKRWRLVEVVERAK